MKKISSLVLCIALVLSYGVASVQAKAPSASKVSLVSVDEMLRVNGLTSKKSQLRALAVNQLGNKYAFFFQTGKSIVDNYTTKYSYVVVEDGREILAGMTTNFPQPIIFTYTPNGHLVTAPDPDELYFDDKKIEKAVPYSGFYDKKSIIFWQGMVTYPMDQFVKRYNPDLKKSEVLYTATGHVGDVRIDAQGNVYFTAAEDGRLPVASAYYLFKNGIKISTHPIDQYSLMVTNNGDFYFTDNGAVYKNNEKVAVGTNPGCLFEDKEGVLWGSTAEGPPNFASHVFKGEVEVSKEPFSMSSMECQTVVGKDFFALANTLPVSESLTTRLYKNGSFIGDESGFDTAYKGMTLPISKLFFDSKGISYVAGYVKDKPMLFVDGKKYTKLFGKNIGSVWAMVNYKGKLRIYYAK